MKKYLKIETNADTQIVSLDMETRTARAIVSEIELEKIEDDTSWQEIDFDEILEALEDNELEIEVKEIREVKK